MANLSCGFHFNCCPLLKSLNIADKADIQKSCHYNVEEEDLEVITITIKRTVTQVLALEYRIDEIVIQSVIGDWKHRTIGADQDDKSIVEGIEEGEADINGQYEAHG